MCPVAFGGEGDEIGVIGAMLPETLGRNRSCLLPVSVTPWRALVSSCITLAAQ